jgi:hypothetical protein
MRQCERRLAVADITARPRERFRRHSDRVLIQAVTSHYLSSNTVSHLVERIEHGFVTRLCSFGSADFRPYPAPV